jgi:hypothetical protein
LKAVYTVKDTRPPRIRIVSPKNPSLTKRDRVTIRVRSEAGARVRLEGRPFLETAPGLFVIKASLTPGRNRLKIDATDPAGNTSTIVLRVSYIDPSRIHRMKDSLDALIDQLEDIRSSIDGIDARTEEIISAIADTQDAERVNQLSAELREIRKSKRALETEIDRAFLEVEQLLESAK